MFGFDYDYFVFDGKDETEIVIEKVFYNFIMFRSGDKFVYILFFYYIEKLLKYFIFKYVYRFMYNDVLYIIKVLVYFNCE